MNDATAASLRQCKGILFDFGGTLDSDGEHWLDRFYELYREAGVDVPQAEIKRVFYHADQLCCDDPQVNHLGLRPLMEHHVAIQFAALGRSNRDQQARLVEGFCSKSEHYLRRNAELLQRLRQRYRMGVVSNFYGNVEVLCTEAGLVQSLAVIVDSTRSGLSKPAPEIFQRALEVLGIDTSAVIFIGDSYERDMIPARQLGMKTVWMEGPHPRLPENPPPVDSHISELTELALLAS